MCSVLTSDFVFKSNKMRNPLTYKVISECSTTKARVGVLNLVHSAVDTPVSNVVFLSRLI